MSDPAVEAAQRAEQASGWWKSGHSTPWDAGYAVDAAREALRPIRELHRELSVSALDEDAEVEHGMRLVLDNLAPLIYSTEELMER
ncbi:hypothetical protein [Mycobacterium aquaticum]|uniref:Uncharacterized protein n=1 Tax=Mycobacterium aquaticum TaxID=1927124 RepID=A0A1X0B722_9MYCO|nr:hypothetical protein [Mycobacterium aquaticum]ORA38083.1 hypothetical protein BST13_05660 [Mycobacterium aquaticum]